MYGRIFDPDMTTYPPQVALALRTPGWDLAASGVGVSTPCGAVSTRESTIFVSGVLDCVYMEGFMMRGWNLILPGPR